MPMGVASMSLTCAMPSASTARICAGRARAADLRLQRGDQALQHHGGLAGAGHAGDHGEPPLGNVHLQRLYRVDPVGGQVDDAVCEQFVPSAAQLPQLRLGLAGEERADLRGGILLQGLGIVPWAITWPPPAPASGPISMIQSASFRICVS